MSTLIVSENDNLMTFTYDDFVKYHGYKSPCGLSQAFKVLELALPLLEDGKPVERRELKITTAFPGPGARDAFEMLARAVTSGRYKIDPSLGGENVTEAPTGKYYFRLEYRDKVVETRIKPEHIREDYIALARKPKRDNEENELLAELRQELADRILPLSSDELFEVVLVND